MAEYGAEAVRPDEIHQVSADVFAPCALEGAINEDTLPQLKAKIVCGTANNQLASAAIGEELHRRGILHAPDYVVNAGGAMNVSLEIDGYNRERAMRLIRSIYHNLEKGLRSIQTVGRFAAAGGRSDCRSAHRGHQQAQTAAGPHRTALSAQAARRVKPCPGSCLDREYMGQTDEAPIRNRRYNAGSTRDRRRARPLAGRNRNAAGSADPTALLQ